MRVTAARAGGDVVTMGGMQRARWKAAARATAAILIVVGALSACGSSSHATSSAPATTSVTRHTAAVATTPASAQPALVAVFHASGHDPHVGNWPVAITLTRGGRPIPGHVSYEFLYGGQVVSTQKVGDESPNFVGHFHDTLTWPANSVGFPITLRVLITTPYGPTHVDWAVQVQH